MKDLAGYRGRTLEFLRRASAGVGDVLEVKTDWGTVTGTVVPRYASADDSHVVLKLKTGYNVGLDVSRLRGAKVVAAGEKPSFSPSPAPKARPGLPKILLLGTGGTIASRVDYRTGAVHPAVDSSDLHALVPELSEIAMVDSEILFNILSENVKPLHWAKLASRIAKAVAQGYEGVVVTHGTDTLGYTAAALSFALQGIPIPVILTAAQRSSDRPSSDATLNLIGSVSIAASADISGVYVGAHLDESDRGVALHAGTRVRKNHTSRRDAFLSVGVPLAAVWEDGKVRLIDDGPPSEVRKALFRPKPKFSNGASLLKFYPSMPPSLLPSLRRSGTKCLVIEGTGLGHVSSDVIIEIGRFVRSGGMACMTSQCINGKVDLDVYDTGRDLLNAGAIPLEDMLSETAVVKASWVLANTRSAEEARRMMLTNLAGEMTSRRLPG
ncbi:MAG: Glu-tRNA(Gln) amidotransferase subunit GatD [Thaumarchaeota archaeon]|nr:Glu-tRNA(Gln) amidotransferase subunit GatD [Nitrososphaerota archaeon]